MKIGRSLRRNHRRKHTEKRKKKREAEEHRRRVAHATTRGFGTAEEAFEPDASIQISFNFRQIR